MPVMGGGCLVVKGWLWCSDLVGVMLWRLLFTGVGGWWAVNAVLMLNCGLVGFGGSAGGLIWMCYPVDYSGSASTVSGWWAGVASLALIAVVLLLTWLPLLVRWWKAKRDPSKTLWTNLSRLPNSAEQPTADSAVPVPEDGPEAIRAAAKASFEDQYGKPLEPVQHVEPTGPSADPHDVGVAHEEAEHSSPSDDLIRRIVLMEERISSNSVAEEADSAEWLVLLKEANRLHNSGALSTGIFRELNTSLLDLIPDPEPAVATGPVVS